jgi:hypothetical protein
VRTTYTLLRHFLVSYGWWRTVRERRSVDADGNPLPWFTYPAIDYLSPLDFSGADVFEYGAGASTLFWAARARRVVSLETDRDWYARLLPQLPANSELKFISAQLPDYALEIRAHGRFDVIVIDGPGQTRLECAAAAADQLKPGGMIILDNSDLVPLSTALLRGKGLLQVDMTGFTPIAANAQCTSFFFSRDASFVTADGIQPRQSVAQTQHAWKDL